MPAIIYSCLLYTSGNSTLATDVDDTQLAVVEQILLIVWLVCIEDVYKRQHHDHHDLGR